MKDLRRQFNRFCFKNRNKGIPNLMLYISIGAAVMAIMSIADPQNILFRVFMFDRSAILHGQIWRLITYPLCYSSGNLFITAITLLCYYSLGRAMENIWGTFRFNLYYFTGIILMDIYCMIFGGQASSYYLNMSLFLGYATMYPDSQFLLFFIVPVRAWIFAVFDLVIVILGLFDPFPYNLFPVIALANYFLFFGPDVANIFPLSWRANANRAVRKASHPRSKTIPFHKSGSYASEHATVSAPYTHKCTVCGRTDVSNPELEFRYCSKCKGYHCYCQDHINNHTHIQ